MIDEETILTLSLEAAWALYKIKFDTMLQEGLETGEKIVSREDYNKARFGVNIDFEIDDYFNHSFREKPKNKEIVIYKDVYVLKDFRTEIEAREKLIRGALLEFYSRDKDIIK